MLIEYYPQGSFIHNLDVRTKTLGFFVITTASFCFENPLINFLILILLWLMLSSMNSPMSKVLKIIKSLLPIFIIMLVITGLSYPTSKFIHEENKRILFSFLPDNGLPLTTGGLYYGLTLVLRIFVMVLASSIITFSTSIEDILQFLKKLRMPHQLAFVIATGIRFIPTMQAKSEMIREAQMARGAEFDKGGIVKKIKSYIPVLIPMIVDSIRMSDNLAIAMLNRGFGSMKNTTNLTEIKMKSIDYLICVITIALLVIVLYAKSKNIGAL